MRPFLRLLPLPLCIAWSLSAIADEPAENWALCPIEPAVPVFSDANTPAGASAQTRAEQSTDIEGDSLQGIQGEVFNYGGNVALRRGDQFLGTDKLIYDTATNRYVAEGNIRYQDSGMRIVAERAEGDQNLDTHTIQDIRYQLISRRGNGGADRIEMEGAHGALYGSTYTTCPPSQPGWALEAKRIDVDTEEGFGTAHNAIIKVGKIPFIWVPYIKFPIDERRRTGLLYPSLGSSNRNGFDFRQPIYLNLAPNYDATLTPRFMSKRGLMLNTESRYLTRTGRGVLQLGYLPSDQLTERERELEKIEVPIAENRRDDDRGIVQFNGQQNINQRWRATANLNWISDVRYLEDFSNSTTGAWSHYVLSKVSLAGNYEHGNVLLTADEYQLADYTLTDFNLPYRRLPRLFAHWEQPFGRWLSAGIDSEAVRFAHANDLRLQGSRLDLKPYLTMPLEGRSWFLKPSLAWRYTAYSVDENAPFANPDRTPTRSLPIASVDAGLFFDRSTTFSGDAYLQTLEPRVFYLRVPYRDQFGLPVFDSSFLTYSWGQLFRDNRFTGADRQTDANQISVALSSRLIRDSDGLEKLSASIGQIRYLDDSLVTTISQSDPRCPEPGTLNCLGTLEKGTSSWIADATYAVNDRWTFNASYQWDPKVKQDDLISARTRYLIGESGIVNLAYRYRRNVAFREDLPLTEINQRALIEQADLSFLYPITPVWSIVGRYYYSIRDKKVLEGIAGIQWESCCVAARLVGRRYVRNREGELNDSIQLEIELKGLGSAGPDTEGRLRSAIVGYYRDDLYLVPPPDVGSQDPLTPDATLPDVPFYEPHP